MKDPERLLDQGTASERLLLGAAEDDGLPAEARQRLAASLGLVGAMPATPTLRPRWWTAIKGLALLSVPVAILLGARHFRAPQEASAPTPIRAAVAAPPSAEAEAPPPAATAAPIDAVGTASASSAPEPPAAASANARRAAPPPPGREPTLAEEVAALQAVRSALGRHDAGAALAALAGYERDFPRRALGLEASMLRIEALIQQGNRPAALALARRLLRGNRTYEARLISLLPELKTP